MKKTQKKLGLSRETVRALSDGQLSDVHGGLTANTCYRSCRVSLCPCISEAACSQVSCPV